MSNFDFAPCSDNSANTNSRAPESAGKTLAMEAWSPDFHNLKPDGLGGPDFISPGARRLHAVTDFTFAAASNAFLKNPLMGGGSAIISTIQALHDVIHVSQSNTKAERVRFGTSLLGDVMQMGGSVATFFPETSMAGIVAYSVGTGLYLSSDFIPYRAVRHK